MLRIELTDPAVLLADKRMGPKFPGQMTGQFPGVAAQSGDWATPGELRRQSTVETGRGQHITHLGSVDQWPSIFLTVKGDERSREKPIVPPENQA